MYPSEDFFNSGDEVELVSGEVSKSVGNVCNGRRGTALYSLEVGGGKLSCKEAFMNCGEVLEDEAKPGVSIKDTVGGVEGRRENLAKSIEGGDSSPGQLRVRDGVIGEWVGDVKGFDVDVVNEAEEELVRRGGLLGDACVRKFEERLAQRVRHGRRRGGEVGRVGFVNSRA
jgi:hypothetical protein